MECFGLRDPLDLESHRKHFPTRLIESLKIIARGGGPPEKQNIYTAEFLVLPL